MTLAFASTEHAFVQLPAICFEPSSYSEYIKQTSRLKRQGFAKVAVISSKTLKSNYKLSLILQELTGKQAQVEALERELADMETVKTDNRALREERERMSKELRESSARYARLQEELGPLQTKNREMSAQCVALQVRHCISRMVFVC